MRDKSKKGRGRSKKKWKHCVSKDPMREKSGGRWDASGSKRRNPLKRVVSLKKKFYDEHNVMTTYRVYSINILRGHQSVGFHFYTLEIILRTPTASITYVVYVRIIQTVKAFIFLAHNTDKLIISSLFFISTTVSMYCHILFCYASIKIFKKCAIIWINTISLSRFH